MMNKIILALALTSVFASNTIADTKKDVLIGVWKVTNGVTYIPDGTTRTQQPRESLIVFTKTHYSFNMAGGGKAHPPSETVFRPTDAEQSARYKTLLINAGKYEIKGDKLIIHPSFALVPEYVGGSGEFTIGEENGVLTLDWIKILSVDGEPDPASAQGVHWKYFLVPVAD